MCFINYPCIKLLIFWVSSKSGVYLLIIFEPIIGKRDSLTTMGRNFFNKFMEVTNENELIFHSDFSNFAFHVAGQAPVIDSDSNSHPLVGPEFCLLEGKP